jgi:hypothetical protein
MTAGEVLVGASQRRPMPAVSFVKIAMFRGGCVPPATFAITQRMSERPTTFVPLRISSW